MLNKSKNMFKKNKKIQPQKKEKISSPGIFTTDMTPSMDRFRLMEEVQGKVFQKTSADFMNAKTGVAMDSSFAPGMKSSFQFSSSTLPDSILSWYGNQSFIGYQMAAILAQHWLVLKCCNMPGEDAIRNGFEVTSNDGEEINADVFNQIRKLDIKYQLTKNLVEFITKGRIFGVRIAIFKIESEDKDFYEKPFNLDGVKANSYKGISQIDPYWITPELDFTAAADPAAIDFYEPTWWRVNGKRYHRTHLIIYRNGYLPDVLKPTYFYGGIPVPQQIYERVYCAERTANEAPQLALTKRSTIIHVDLSQAIAKQHKFEERMQNWAYFRDNYGIKVLGKEETAEQFDTSLADLNEAIMTQYQIVAAASNIPATKLLGTQPKGFNSTGEYEEASYHEFLKSVQTEDLTPLIERHHQLLIKSELQSDISTTIKWNPLDEMTAEEKANMNKLKADTGLVLQQAGAIDGEDERQRVINDPDSGYNGMEDEMKEDYEELPEVEKSEITAGT